MTTYRINNGQLFPVEPIGQNQKSTNVTDKQNAATFKDLLEKTIQDKTSVKISYHAQQRLQQRNIVLDEKDMNALKNAMEKAEQKGARESLLLYKDMALITSIKNRTIITAVDSKSAGENVFTNIDSAVLVTE